MKTLRMVVLVLVGLVILGVATTRHLFYREPVPTTSSYVLDRAALAALARSMPGELPLRVNHQVVALAHLPRGAVFAGERFTPHRMVHGVYQVVFEDGYVLIDAGFGQAYFDQTFGGEDDRYDGASFEKVKRALEGARTIVLTHEHSDHIDGLARVDDPAALAPRIVMNAAQRDNPETRELLPAALVDAIEPIPGDAPRAIAPGVVLVPAAGHTPGSQLVYVLTRDGRELLFVGDVAWHMDALRNLHYRPRLVTDYFLDEDRAAVLAQFRTLHDLLPESGLQIVVSHDAEQRRDLVRAGVLGDGLELD